MEEKTVIVPTSTATPIDLLPSTSVAESTGTISVRADSSSSDHPSKAAPYMPVTQGAKMYDLVSRALKKDHEVIETAINEVNFRRLSTRHVLLKSTFNYQLA